MASQDDDTHDPLPAAQQLGLSALVHLRQVTSTMDEAHRLAAGGAGAGTCVIADEQTAGRGRGGRSWSSADRDGLWLTLIERPADSEAVDVLSLRLGLSIARVLEKLDTSDETILLKWPNDVYQKDGKVAGILVEARWRQQAIEWVAIGVGINLSRPDAVDHAAGLSRRVTRNELLRALIPQLRHAAEMNGHLSDDEMMEWTSRDLARGRSAIEPGVGIVEGITRAGAICIRDEATGARTEYRSGSLRLA